MTITERYNRLAEAVTIMRKAQRRYFDHSTRTRDSLANAKKCEQIVDRMLANYRRQDPQQRIFD